MTVAAPPSGGTVAFATVTAPPMASNASRSRQEARMEVLLPAAVFALYLAAQVLGEIDAPDFRSGRLVSADQFAETAQRVDAAWAVDGIGRPVYITSARAVRVSGPTHRGWAARRACP